MSQLHWLTDFINKMGCLYCQKFIRFRSGLNHHLGFSRSIQMRLLIVVVAVVARDSSSKMTRDQC
jgi:hypothetical protein